jgi:hypothetical protein
LGCPAAAVVIASLIIIPSLVVEGAVDVLAGEEADVAEVARSLAWVELLGFERVLVRRVQRVGWIIPQIGRDDKTDGNGSHRVPFTKGGRERHPR